MKIRVSIFLSTFLKDRNFVFFFGLILNNHVLQYDDRVLRQYYSPIFDLDNMTKTSA